MLKFFLVFLLVIGSNGTKSAFYAGEIKYAHVQNWLSRVIGGEVPLLDLQSDIPL